MRRIDAGLPISDVSAAKSTAGSKPYRHIQAVLRVFFLNDSAYCGVQVAEEITGLLQYASPSAVLKVNCAFPGFSR